jgi:transcriptional regulator of acetoin/glycerol metabolism
MTDMPSAPAEGGAVVDVRSVFAARDALLSHGTIPAALRARVNPAVLASWHRSLASGASTPIPVKELDDRWLTRTTLRRAAEPVLADLAASLADLETGVLLADHNAVVLKRWIPDKSIIALMDSVHSEAGYNVAEDLVGTNGVGTVVETGRATQITGPEHLSPVLQTFTCVGAPIHHPITRRLEGVITLSCLSDAGNALLTPLLISTAREIEHCILDQASVRERLLLDAYLKISKTRRTPVAAIGPDLFLAGPQVTDLLRDIDQAKLWEYVRGMAHGSTEALRTAVADQLRLIDCQPVEADGRVIGAIIEFDTSPGSHERPEVHKVATAHRAAPVLPGKSAALAQALSHAAKYAAAGSLVISGEPGVGKWTLAQSLVSDADRVARFDAADIVDIVERIRSAIGERVDVILLRHIEALPDVTAGLLASTLFDDPAEHTVRVIATVVGEVSPAELGRRRLFDLICSGHVRIPPLRERREDISEAASSLVALHGGARTKRIAPSALRILMRAPWPGNLRQLEVTLRGVLAMTSSYELVLDDLPSDLLTHARRRQLSPIEELELNAILDALQRHHGNKLAAANAIGISRSTLYRKMRSYHVDPDRAYF